MNPFKFTLSKNTLTLVAILILIVLVLLMLGINYNQRIQLQYAQSVYKEQQKEFLSVQHVLEQKVNELGQQETKVTVLEGSNELLKLHLQNQRSFIHKALADFEIKLKDLKSVTNLRVTTSGQFVTVTRDSIITKVIQTPDSSRPDTVKSLVKIIDYKEKDGWFSLNGVISNDTMTFTPVFYNDFDLAYYRERKPKRYFLDLFPGKRTVGKVINRNPYSNTTHFETVINLGKRKKFLGIF